MFDRFTDAAKKTMSRSRQEALRLHDDCIDVRHILLGLLRQPCPDVATALTNVGVQPAQLLAAIEAVIPAGNGQPNSMGQMPFTVAGKQVLMKAMEAAAAMHHTWIGTEHLLLGAVAAAERPIATAIASLGLQYESLQQAVAALATGAGEATPGKVDRGLRAPSFRLADVLVQLAEMERWLRVSTDAAASVQQLEAAAALRDLLDQCKQAGERLRALPGGA